MQRRYMQADVFSGAAYKGNGLAVVLEGTGLSVAQMQAFAAWTQQAETTFLLPARDPAADYALRIFSASGEMPFAGHPTLGSAVAWQHAGGVPRHSGRVVQECVIGLVEIDMSAEWPAFVAPPTQIMAMPEQERARICAALGLSAADVVSSVTLHNGVLRHVIEVADATRALALDAQAVGLPDYQGVSVIGRHAAGSDADYEVRNLCPASLMPEDAVTGSLIAALGVWLQGQGRLGAGLIMAQGSAMGRQGRARVAPRGDDVLVGGQVRIMIEGLVDL